MQLNQNINPERDQVRQFRKNVSLNTFLAVPFMSMNFYHTVFFAIYMVITIGLFVYKVQKYPFPQYAISMQGVLLALFALSHYMRYTMAKQGISQKESIKLIYFIVVSVLIIPLYVFQLRIQMYVTIIEYILSWLGLGLCVLELGAVVWIIIVFTRKKNAS